MGKTEKTQPVKKIKLHIAWTVDDGPTPNTDKMLSVFNDTLKEPIPATWFIQFDYLTQKNRLAFYKNLQDKKKHEIAIHGVSTVVNHIHWFPSSKFQSFPSVDEALEGIAIFNKYLSDNGIQARFVRAPTGLHSELSSYLNKLKVEGNTYQIARNIIKGEKLKEVKRKKNGKNAKEVKQYRLKKKSQLIS